MHREKQQPPGTSSLHKSDAEQDSLSKEAMSAAEGYFLFPQVDRPAVSRVKVKALY